MRFLKKRGLIALMMLVPASFGCSRNLSDSQYEVIIAWLACDDCFDGEREAVAALGSKAIPALAVVLERVPDVISVATRRELENSWSPELGVGREAYIQRYLTGAEVLAQMRAGVSLGDLGADQELRDALDQAVPRGYGEDLVRVLRGALQWAENGGPIVAVVRLLPNPLSLPLGSTAGFAASVEDEFGNPLEEPVSWTSSDLTVVQVDEQGVLIPGVEGVATVSAEAGGVSGEATVVVIPPRITPPRLEIVSGSHQRGPPGALLSNPATVRAVNQSGEVVSGVYLEWRVIQGEGSVSPLRSVTDALGEASARWTVGDLAEPQRLEARIPGSNAVVFRATVVPGTPQSVFIEAASTVAPVGGLLTLGALFEDAAGNQWTPDLITWSSGDPTIATVNDEGVVVGGSPGETQVTAIAEGISGSTDILVVSPRAPGPGATAVVGHLFIDEGPTDGSWNNEEPTLAVPGIPVSLANPPVNSFSFTTLTDQNGGFVFPQVPPGTMTVEVDVGSPRIPDAVTLLGGAQKVVDVSAGQVDTADFSFGIEEQTVVTRTFLETASPAEPIRAVGGVVVDLYPTEAAAVAQNPAERLSRDTSDASGISLSRFPRALNTDESGLGTDSRVFVVPAAVADPYIEVIDDSIRVLECEPTDSLFLLPDSVRARAGRTALRVRVGTANGPLQGWVVDLLSDTTGLPDLQATTGIDGYATFDVEVPLPNLPDTLFVRTSGPPSPPGVPPFEQKPRGLYGREDGRHLRYVFNGSSAPADSVDLGALRVQLLSSDLVVRIHHEADDSASGISFTGGDDFDYVDQAQVTLYELTETLDAIATLVPDPVTGQVIFADVPTGSFYALTASPPAGRGLVVSDTLLLLDGRTASRPGGDAPVLEVCPLGDPLRGCSAFAYKFWDATISGTVSAEGDGLGVSVTATGPANASLVTGAGGYYTFTRMPVGDYVVTIDASAYPDISFPSTSMNTTISFISEVVTVDFAGTYIRTASITGTVTIDGSPASGIVVTVTGGPDGVTASTMSDSGGTYLVGGLRAGSYTITVSNIPAGVTFPGSSQDVTLGTGGSAVVDFAGFYTRPGAGLGGSSSD